MRALSYIGAEKIKFPPKPDIQTDIQTYIQMDISVYRVALLLKCIDRDRQTDRYIDNKKINRYIFLIFNKISHF